MEDLDGMHEAFGEGHEETLQTVESLVQLYEARDELDKAAEWKRSNLRTRATKRVVLADPRGGEASATGR